MTNKQKKDLETIMYFIPEVCKKVKITDEDIQMFFEYSDQGKHKEKVGTWVMGYQNGFNALCEGKKWRGIHIHEMYEKGADFVAFLKEKNEQTKGKQYDTLWYKDKIAAYTILLQDMQGDF